MTKIYLISDTHFGQRFVIEFSNRPFKNVKEMQIRLMANWNEEVNKKDLVIIVGDFYAGDKVFSKYLLNNLNGEKILIKGNHDYKYRYKKLLETEDIKVYSKIEFYVYNHKFILTHKPLKYIPKQAFNIHGHLHRKLLSPKYDQSKYYNVAVEHNLYKPIPVERILEDKLGIRNINQDIIIKQIKHSDINKQNQLPI